MTELLLLPPPEGPFDAAAARRFLAEEHGAYVTILGQAAALGVRDERLREALGSLAQDLRALVHASCAVLERGEPVEVVASYRWEDPDRTELLRELAALGASLGPLFADELGRSLLDDVRPAYAALHTHLRWRIEGAPEASHGA